MTIHPELALIGVPYDVDRHREATGAAPQALYAAGLLKRLAAGGLHVARDVTVAADLGAGDQTSRAGRLQAAVAAAVAGAAQQGLLPVVLGGDCLNAVGVWSGLARAGLQDVGVAWFDAHGDWNTEQTSRSGLLVGMPYAAICGHGNAELRRIAGLARPAPERRCALLGVRDLDPAEAALLASTEVRIAGADALARGGQPAPRALESAAALYLHLDVDVLDPAAMPAVRFPAPGGLSEGQVVALARELLGGRPPAALTLASLDPALDRDGQSAQTVIRMACALLAAPS